MAKAPFLANFFRETGKIPDFLLILGRFFCHFSGEKAGNKRANNFFSKKSCHYHIWGYTTERLPTKWG
jgi:hypothetical protein